MPNLTVSLDHLGIGSNVDVLKAWVEASTSSWTDGATTITIPDARLDFTAGTAVADLKVPPSPIMYQVVVRYRRPGDREISLYESGWFAFTGAANLAALATVPLAPEPWGSTFRTEMEALRDEAAAIVDGLVPLRIRSDVASPYAYIGTAPVGTADADTGWLASRIHLTAHETHTATGAWDDRAVLPYES